MSAPQDPLRELVARIDHNIEGWTDRENVAVLRSVRGWAMEILAALPAEPQPPIDADIRDIWRTLSGADIRAMLAMWQTRQGAATEPAPEHETLLEWATRERAATESADEEPK